MTTAQEPIYLTAREKEVRDLVAMGWRNRRIAEHLGLSDHTVRAHIRSMMLKLDVHTRGEVVYLTRDGG